MTFLVSKRARRHIEGIHAWWLRNRGGSPWLFLDELAEAERLLRENPSFGVLYTRHEGDPVRRVLLARTRKHLYYRYDPGRDELVVLAVWGAPRGRGPRL